MRNRHRRAIGGACATAALLLMLAACQPQGTGERAQPAAEPVAAVQAMAAAMADNDLQRYADLSVPPEQRIRLEAAWQAGHSRWPLTELPLHDQLLPMLGALAADDASARLQSSFDRQLAGQAAAVRQAAQAMGVFGVQYLQHENTYTASQQAHYIQVVTTLAGWAAQAPLSDRARARAAIAALTGAARTTGITEDAHLQQAGMRDSLARLAPFLGTFKAVLARYGLDLDASLRGIDGQVLSVQGDNALVQLSYPLAGERIELRVPLTRRDGHWYLTRTLADTDALLRRHDAAAATPDLSGNVAPGQPAVTGPPSSAP